MGIDIASPQLSWVIDSARPGEQQTAYQILAASSPERLQAGTGDLWDSGRVASSQMAQVAYAGKALVSRAQVYWKVRFWDAAGQESAWSAPAQWEMGLLDKSDWKARWITANRVENQADPVTRPAPWFRTEFDLPTGAVKVRVYICGLGWNEVYVNGERVGDHVLSPNQTDYEERRVAKPLYPYDNQPMAKRLFYVVHDATALLRPGRNAIGIVLGNGWYNQRDRIVEALEWYNPPKLLAQLEVTLADGRRVVVASSEQWKVSEDPILHDGIFTGETYDARLEMPGWSEAGFNDAAWSAALPALTPKGTLRAQIAPPDRVVRSVKPVAVSEVKPEVHTFDAGENLVGWPRITLRGPRGRRVTMRFSEELGPDFHQADHYTLKGGGAETYEPRFTWHGFRHMEVTGSPTAPDVSFQVVHSDVAATGRFECSNALLTKLFANYRRTQLSNMHGGVPSDCPHRERLGYTGDGQIASEAAMYTLDMAAFYAKWIEDIAGSQNKVSGFVPHTAPFEGGAGGYAWGSAITVMPWNYYRYYGDKRVLETNFAGMMKWLEYCGSKVDADGVVVKEEPGTVWIGDWSAPLKKMAAPELVNTAYYAYCAALTQKVAGVLERWEDAGRLKALHEKICADFDRRYYVAENQQYSDGVHGCNFFALGLGLVQPGRVPGVLRRGIELLLNEAGGHFDMGFIGVPLVLKVLAQHRRTDVAYKLMTQTTYPSFNDAIVQGATTVWENWNRGSHSHPMFGAVCAWMFQSLAGINPDTAGAGFRRIRMRPEFVPELGFVRASYDSMAGPVRSEWERRGGTYEWSIQVPANCSAVIDLPGTPERMVGAGRHRFTVASKGA